MPILDLQRRLREAGRIRIGVQVPTSNGKKRPSKLSTFRLTSQDETVIRAAAGMFGGTPQRWADAPVGEQWEVITESNVIPVVIPPAAAAFSQWYEQWSGGGCVRRCDGMTELLKDTPCPCALEDERQCKPTTRLNVILADLPGLGAWRLESHGWYAATELAGTVEVCLNAATRGQLLPAVLRLEQRVVNRPGEATKKFAVPILDIQMTPSSLGLVVGTAAALQPAPADQPVQGAWQPIAGPPPVAELGAGEVGAAIKDAGTGGPKRRKNSPPELPPTGVKPRGRGAAAANEEPPAGDDRGALPPAQMIAMLLGKHGVTSDADRYRAVGQMLGLAGPVESTKQLKPAEAGLCIKFLGALADGEGFPWDVGEGAGSTSDAAVESTVVSPDSAASPPPQQRTGTSAEVRAAASKAKVDYSDVKARGGFTDWEEMSPEVGGMLLDWLDAGCPEVTS